MNIHFSNVNLSSQSGPNSFAARLALELESRGHGITLSPAEEYDVALIFIENAFPIRKGARIIQRLDGIWFKPEQFHTHNKRIRAIYEIADHVIFQSEFDRDMIQHHWGVSREFSVIQNGIHPDSNVGELSGRFEIPHDVERVFVCSANWHPQKRLSECLRLYRQIRNPKDILIIMGNNPDAKLDLSLREHWVGSLSHDMCLAFFKRADWMIHLAWLDHCPNVVIEALSQGCPVICAADGGTKELVEGNGIILPEYDQYRFQLTDYDNPPKVNMDNFVLPDRPDVDASRFDIRLVADKYESVLRGNS